MSGTSPTVRILAASPTVNVPTGGGTYFLWARVKGPNIGSDAIYAGFDNTWDRVFPAASLYKLPIMVETIRPARTAE
jgi:beta-lactamase class A